MVHNQFFFCFSFSFPDSEDEMKEEQTKFWREKLKESGVKQSIDKNIIEDIEDNLRKITIESGGGGREIFKIRVESDMTCETERKRTKKASAKSKKETSSMQEAQKSKETRK